MVTFRNVACGLGLCTLGATAFAGRSIRLTNGGAGLLTLQVPGGGGPLPAKAEIVCVEPHFKEETPLYPGHLFCLDDDETIHLEDRSTTTAADGSMETLVMFAVSDEEPADVLGGSLLMFRFKKHKGASEGSAMLSLTPASKSSGERTVDVILDPDAAGTSEKTSAYVVRPRKPATAAGAGAGLAERKEDRLVRQWVAMDLSGDEPSPGAAADPGGAPAAPREEVKVVRRSEFEADVLKYQKLYGPWLAGLARSAPPTAADFSPCSKGEPSISRAAFARKDPKIVDGFDQEVGPRHYEPGAGLFADSIDSRWQKKALYFLRRCRMADAWAAHYLEVSIEEYRAMP